MRLYASLRDFQLCATVVSCGAVVEYAKSGGGTGTKVSLELKDRMEPCDKFIAGTLWMNGIDDRVPESGCAVAVFGTVKLWNDVLSVSFDSGDFEILSAGLRY